MTDKASPAGWVVQVTVPAPPRVQNAKWSAIAMVGAPSFRYFNVAIAGANNAVEATAKHLAKSEAKGEAKAETKDGEICVVRGLSSEEIAVLSLSAGEVRAA